jgi:N-methylhydantoinase A/oxoprolinase/acetone carboxylase beta subunit
MCLCSVCLSCIFRYAGTDTAIMTPIEVPNTSSVHGTDTSISTCLDVSSCSAAFTAIYSREYGFELQGRDILVDDVRVRCVGHNALSGGVGESRATEDSVALELPVPHSLASVYFEGGRVDTPVYLMKQFTDSAAGA